MTWRKRDPLPTEEQLAFGTICGCGKCMYCQMVSTEATWAKMQEDVKKAVARADSDKPKEWK